MGIEINGKQYEGFWATIIAGLIGMLIIVFVVIPLMFLIFIMSPIILVAGFLIKLFGRRKND